MHRAAWSLRSRQVLEHLDIPLGVDMTVPNAARMYDYYLGGSFL